MYACLHRGLTCTSDVEESLGKGRFNSTAFFSSFSGALKKDKKKKVLSMAEIKKAGYLFPLCIYFLVSHERERERLQCAIHSAFTHEADPEQTELAQYGKHLTGAGIKASYYLLVLCSVTISALLGQVRVVLRELAHFLHSAASAELSHALFLPRF